MASAKRPRRKSREQTAAEAELAAENTFKPARVTHQRRAELVAELLGVEAELVSLEDEKREFGAAWKARRESWLRRRNEVLAELRGEGRQLELPSGRPGEGHD